MDAPRRPQDVLAQPSRGRLFEILTDLRRPADTDELAGALGLHRNGVRMHLDRMLEAGLVTREVTRQPRGRPKDMWALAAGANPGGDAPTAYLNLGRWLAQIIASRKTGPRAVEAAGREIGQGLAPEGTGGSAEEQMHATLISLGFQPQREPGSDGGLSYRLGNCPYRDAVRESQDVICGLHRGITRGLLDTIAPDTELTAFVPHDPDQAGCLIALRGGLAEEASGAGSGRG